MIPIPPQLLLSLGTKVLPQLLGSFGSFATAAVQKKAMDEANAAAAKAVADARAKLMQAPLEEVQVPTEAYENAMQNITAQSMQLTEAARETGARELTASIGRIGAAGLNATEQQREAMASDIYKRDMAVAQDEARRLGGLANLDVMEARGAEMAAAQAAEARGAAIAGGLSSLGAAVGGAFESMPLYGFGRQTGEEIARGELLGSQGLFGRQIPGSLQGQEYLMNRAQIGANLGALQNELDFLNLGQVPLIPNR
jgi:hypothetical protein